MERNTGEQTHHQKVNKKPVPHRKNPGVCDSTIDGYHSGNRPKVTLLFSLVTLLFHKICMVSALKELLISHLFADRTLNILDFPDIWILAMRLSL